MTSLASNPVLSLNGKTEFKKKLGLQWLRYEDPFTVKCNYNLLTIYDIDHLNLGTMDIVSSLNQFSATERKFSIRWHRECLMVFKFENKTDYEAFTEYYRARDRSYQPRLQGNSSSSTQSVQALLLDRERSDPNNATTSTQYVNVLLSGDVPDMIGAVTNEMTTAIQTAMRTAMEQMTTAIQTAMGRLTAALTERPAEFTSMKVE